MEQLLVDTTMVPLKLPAESARQSSPTTPFVAAPYKSKGRWKGLRRQATMPDIESSSLSSAATTTTDVPSSLSPAMRSGQLDSGTPPAPASRARARTFRSIMGFRMKGKSTPLSDSPRSLTFSIDTDSTYSTEFPPPPHTAAGDGRTGVLRRSKTDTKSKSKVKAIPKSSKGSHFPADPLLIEPPKTFQMAYPTVYGSFGPWMVTEPYRPVKLPSVVPVTPNNSVRHPTATRPRSRLLSDPGSQNARDSTATVRDVGPTRLSASSWLVDNAGPETKFDQASIKFAPPSPTTTAVTMRQSPPSSLFESSASSASSVKSSFYADETEEEESVFEIEPRPSVSARPISMSFDPRDHNDLSHELWRRDFPLPQTPDSASSDICFLPSPSSLPSSPRASMYPPAPATSPTPSIPTSSLTIESSQRSNFFKKIRLPKIPDSAAMATFGGYVPPPEAPKLVVPKVTVRQEVDTGQEWKGEWNQGNMDEVVNKLRALPSFR